MMGHLRFVKSRQLYALDEAPVEAALPTIPFVKTVSLLVATDKCLFSSLVVSLVVFAEDSVEIVPSLRGGIERSRGRTLALGKLSNMSKPSTGIGSFVRLVHICEKRP
jgi:hypothetical protein